MRGIQAVRGMNDILPEETPAWLQLEDRVRRVVESYGYEQIRLPLLERTELFKRTIGEVTDIVEKEMYTFDDRNGESLTLRPEGTAGCVRAGIERGLLHNQVRRLWYAGPMFRHERPQKGRYRQFHQIGVEAFGLNGPDIDAELILLSARLWRVLGLEDVRLEINSLGSGESRAEYRQQLVGYLQTCRDRLDEDSLRRLESNPLRILDSKNNSMKDVIDNAPQLSEYLDRDSKAHINSLCSLLDHAEIGYTINPRLVRGLDYYGLTVFEWVTDRLGAQGTVCAGGRYDGLVAQLGGRGAAAVGMAMGVERLVALLDEGGVAVDKRPLIYLCILGDEQIAPALRLAEEIRDGCSQLDLVCHAGGGGLKAQLKRADRCGAEWALILGEEERKAGGVVVKGLRQGEGQERIDQGRLIEYLNRLNAGRPA